MDNMSNTSKECLLVGAVTLFLGLVCGQAEVICTALAKRERDIARACDEGVNIDLLRDSDIAKQLTSAPESGDFPLVCVKGVVKTCDHDVSRGMGTQESSRLHGLDDRHCAISVLTTYENYDKILGTGVVTDRKIRQVPWCLTSYDSRGSKVVVDQECVRQSLAGDIYPMLSNSKHIPHGSMLDRAAVHQHDSGHLSQAGLETVPRSWWEILSLKPRECVVNHILPLLTKCSLIGSITLNTEGEYLLTAHPKYGFCIFSDIAFASVAAARKASCQSWQIWASRCDSMRVFFYCGFVVSAGMFIFSRPWWRHRDSSSPAPSSAYIPEPANDANYPNIQGRNDNVADENVENMNMCVICLSSARTVLVRPCRHLCLCRECYEDNYRIPSANNRVCPICRKDIASFDVIYNP